MSKTNNSFRVVSSITDDKGVVWDIAHAGVNDYFVLMEPEEAKPGFAGQIIPYVNIRGRDYVLLTDVERLLAPSNPIRD